MSFLAPKEHPNKSVSQAHKVVRVEIEGDAAKAIVNSFASESALSAVPALIVWQDTYPVPLSAVADIEGFLIGDSGPFAGGVKLPEGKSIDVARERRWSEIKLERDQREAGGFPYLGKVFDSDPRSVQRILGAVLAAQVAVTNDLDFSIDWTVADNSVVTLSADELIAMPAALAAYANHLHAVSRDLRVLIDAAETVEEVRGVQWPSDLPAPEPEVEQPPAEEGGDA